MKISSDVLVVFTEAEFAHCGKVLARGVDLEGFDVAWHTVVNINVVFVDVLMECVCVHFAPVCNCLFCALWT
jgi:hypothetical protein